MAREYASQQAQGFKNHVENIAIVGVSTCSLADDRIPTDCRAQATGQIGSFIVASLLKTGKHTIRALTRGEGTGKFPDGVEVVKINYDDQASLVHALQGQEVLIITMSVTAPPDQQAKLVEAAATANVPWILPNEWGISTADVQLGKDVFLGVGQKKTQEHIERLGTSSWIAVVCGFWYEYSLGSGPLFYGFDIPNRTVTFYDDGNARIDTSTLPQCGRAVASLLNLKVLPDDENDKGPCLSQFRNGDVHISSFKVSQRDMLDSLMRVTGTTAKDWKTESEPSAERYKAGLELFKTGDRAGFAKLLYARVFYPDGSGELESRHGLDNTVLGLPKEDLDEFTKIAVDRAEKHIPG